MKKINLYLFIIFIVFLILLTNIAVADVIVVAPTNGTNFTGTALFNVTFVNGTDITTPTNVTFYYNKSAALTYIGNVSTCARINATNGSACWGTLTISGLTDGRYSLNATMWNGSTNANSTNVISIVTFDSTSPSINISYPFVTGLNSTRNGNVSINYTVSDALIGVQSCWWTNNSGLSNKTVICGTNITGENFTDGLKIVTVYVNDSLNNINSSSIQFGVDTKAPNVSTPTLPITGQNYSAIQLFSAVVSDSTAGVQKVFFYIINNNGSQQTNYTASLVSGAWVVNVTTSSFSDGTYNVSVYANDSVNNLNSTTKVTSVTFDNTAPVTPVLSNLVTTTSTITATITVSDALSGISQSCTVDRAGASVSGTGGSQTLTESNLACGSVYYYIATCSDLAGNGAVSSTYSYTTSNCDSGGAGGGSSGGGGTISGTTYIPSAQNLDVGYTKQLATNDKIKVSVKTETHYVGIKSLTATQAVISIMSNETILTLSSGQDGKVDVNNDGYYDVYVKLNSISDNKAELFVQTINELIPQGESAVTTTGQIGEMPKTTTPEQTQYWVWIIVVIIIIIVIIAVVGMKKKRKK